MVTPGIALTSRSSARRSVVVNGDSSRHLIDPTKHTDAGRGHASTPTRSTSGLLFRGHQPDTWAAQRNRSSDAANLNRASPMSGSTARPRRQLCRTPSVPSQLCQPSAAHHERSHPRRVRRSSSASEEGDSVSTHTGSAGREQRATGPLLESGSVDSGPAGGRRSALTGRSAALQGPAGSLSRDEGPIGRQS
jgi:hypothetical protein